MRSEAELQEQLVLEHLKKLNKAEKNFIPFVRHVWPDFISGFHHRKIAEKFEAIKDKKNKASDREYATKAYEVRICFLPISVVARGQ